MSEVLQTVDALEPEPSDQEQASWPPYKRPSTDQLAKVLRLNAEGLSVRQIGQVTGIPHYTVWRTLERFKSTTSEAGNLLRAAALPAAEALVSAIPRASARGDHRPALDLLKAVKVIEENPTIQQTVIVGGLDALQGANIVSPWAASQAENTAPILESGAIAGQLESGVNLGESD